MTKKSLFVSVLVVVCMLSCSVEMQAQRHVQPLLNNWLFMLGDVDSAMYDSYNGGKWRVVNIPHDWSIEGNFSDTNKTTSTEAALPAGIGWYKKGFFMPTYNKGKKIDLHFDGIFQHADLWVNGKHVGRHNNGYTSFSFDITSYLKFSSNNTIAVRVDNAQQPNSRFYTGSGIYRKVWMDIMDSTHMERSENHVVAQHMSGDMFSLANAMNIVSADSGIFTIVYELKDVKGLTVEYHERKELHLSQGSNPMMIHFFVKKPMLWSPEYPVLYTLVTKLMKRGVEVDRLEEKVGFRYFKFDAKEGFSLNGNHYLIKGVCEHHDLGALGAAQYTSALKRKLFLLKEMGANAIRTAHNPPSVEFLDLCDSMGFLVMDELYDTWVKKKNKYDQHIDFKKDYATDIEDWVKRDRNHPSVFVWSIGNEIPEQFDSSGIRYAKELTQLVKQFDVSRPVTSALTENNPEKNFIYKSGALDILGFNYKLKDYPDLPKRFPGTPIFATETASAFSMRGFYDMPSDSARIWPPDSKPFKNGDSLYRVSSYDDVFAYWGSTHEKGWLAVKNATYMGGIFAWSGFDFLGEPFPYVWPARSSYYGILDLAGFPKDVFYMYQSEWSNKPVLHLFPHWNWQRGQLVDVWAYYSGADEVELYLNGKSVGIRKKTDSTLHVKWKLAFEPGELKVVSRKAGAFIQQKFVRTAEEAYTVRLKIENSGLGERDDLIYVTAEILDKSGQLVQTSDKSITFSVSGSGKLLATDNGNPVDHTSFSSASRQTLAGKCIAIIQKDEKSGFIKVSAKAIGLIGADLVLSPKR